jgi:CRP/FNR family transcriptional regulator, cyclic AMP receptor protein
MPITSSIRLFEEEPGLIRFLGPVDAERASHVRLPVHAISKGDAHIGRLFEQHNAFGAIVLEGMLLQALRLSGHTGQRLLGPGDVLSLTHTPSSMLVIEATCRATVPTKLVLLEREMLLAVRRWPGIAAGLHAHIGEQSERLVTQLMICQLPRVGDRLLALLWLLAESWGQVTPNGTLLPIPLTHASLGGLIGARRATVTLAVGALSEAGLISRESRGWMLHGSPDELSMTTRRERSAAD